MAKMEDFPPSIQELLKKRGWTWPPDEKLQKKMDEAAKRFCGSLRVDPDILREIMWEMRGIKSMEKTQVICTCIPVVENQHIKA